MMLRCQLASHLWLANRTVRTVPVCTTQYSNVLYRYCFDSQSSEPICIIAIDFRSICLSLKVIFSIAILSDYFFFLYPLLFLWLPSTCLMLAYFAKLKRRRDVTGLFFLFYIYETSSINIRFFIAWIYCMHYLSVWCYVDVYAQVHM